MRGKHHILYSISVLQREIDGIDEQLKHPHLVKGEEEKLKNNRVSLQGGIFELLNLIK